MHRHLTVNWQVTDAGYRPQLLPPKTNSGMRIVPIDTLTAQVLTEHRSRQEAERRLWGAGWRDLDPVLTKEDGGVLRPDAVTHLFAQLEIDPPKPR